MDVIVVWDSWKWLRTCSISPAVPVSFELHTMDEGLMHPKDRGKIWPRGMQANLSMKECESRRTFDGASGEVLRRASPAGKGLSRRSSRKGFVCPICGPTSCSHQLSVSAKTMIEGTHLALRKWFVAMWFISSQKGRDQRQAGCRPDTCW